MLVNVKKHIGITLWNCLSWCFHTGNIKNDCPIFYLLCPQVLPLNLRFGTLIPNAGAVFVELNRCYLELHMFPLLHVHVRNKWGTLAVKLTRIIMKTTNVPILKQTIVKFYIALFSMCCLWLKSFNVHCWLRQWSISFNLCIYFRSLEFDNCYYCAVKWISFSKPYPDGMKWCYGFNNIFTI